ncbi:MAG: HAMP domain-containing protein [Armatimonadetes bacterium]|nr:HAMP domain-containing protein [Armatimonadota bacterium]
MKKFDNLKLSHKFAVSFGIILCLLCFLGWSGYAGNRRLGKHIHTIKTDILPGQTAGVELTASPKDDFIALTLATISYNKANAKAGSDQFEDEMKAKQEDIDAFEKTVTTQEARDLFEAYKKDWDNYVVACKKYLADHSAGASEDQLTKDFQAVVTGYNTTNEQADKIVEYTATHGDKVVAESEADTNRTEAKMLWASIVAVAIGLLFAIKLTKSITGPVAQVAEGLRSLATKCVPWLNDGLSALAQGDLTRRIVPVSQAVQNPTKDEIGQMATTFNEMLGQIQGAIAGYNQATDGLCNLVREVGASSYNVADNANNVASSAEQISAGASQISSGSTSLATSATEAAAIVEEMQAQANEVGAGSEKQAAAIDQASAALAQAAAGIQKVDEAAKEMTKSAQKGNESVSQTVEAMQELKVQIEKASTKVQELDAAGEKIGAIVGTIDSIAAQTNLLALNAAIEAARAGEHGRGFAVVADEVRKLAEQSSHATQEIRHLIESVRENVVETVDSITTTASKAEDGVEKSSAAGQALDEILEAVVLVANYAQEVEGVTGEVKLAMKNVAESAQYNLTSSREMQVGSQKVSRAITDVASISEESAACAEELSSGVHTVTGSVGDLSRLADDLQQQIRKFKLLESTKEHAQDLPKAA